MTGGQALVRSLEAHGVTAVFGIPGTHNLAVYDALLDSPIRHVSARHEQGAAFMADGYARAGGEFGVCLSTTGPAALNTLTPLGTAFSDSSRVLCVASQIQSDYLGREKGLLHECSGQSGGFRAVTKWCQQATTVEAIPWLVREAFAQLGSGRPRPVALEIPCDVLDSTGQPALPAPLTTELEQPGQEELTQACRLLEEASRPVIWAGGGVIRAGASAALTRLAERLQSPVFTTTLGKGAIPEDHPLSGGNTLLHPVGRAYLETCDLMLAVGTRFKEIETERWRLKLPEQLIHIDIDPTEIGRNYEVSAAVVGHAKPSLEGLLERCQGATTSRDRPREVQALRDRIWGECRQRAPAAVELVECLRAELPRDSILVCDLTAAATWCHHLLEVYQPAGFHSPWGFCTLGFGLPAAIGARMAQPQRPVVLLSGDGGFLFNCQELATAVECGLPLVMVVFNDKGYGVLRPQQMARYGRTHAADLVGPDFAALARAFGAAALRVERLQDLSRNLLEALRQPGPCLVELTAQIPWPPIETTAGMFAQAEVPTQ
ncbi:MAG: thiamine pyrophosphate-binding protein [Acidobacteriota bacterium]|nr:thiamine pyrophosphate-binding protein [Acidobacteriota bacterium]